MKVYLLLTGACAILCFPLACRVWPTGMNVDEPAPVPLAETRPAGTESTAGEIVDEIPSDGIFLDQLERELIIKALKQTKGNQTEAAKMLGISRRTLQYRIHKKYRISPRDFADD